MYRGPRELEERIMMRKITEEWETSHLLGILSRISFSVSSLEDYQIGGRIEGKIIRTFARDLARGYPAVRERVHDLSGHISKRVGVDGGDEPFDTVTFVHQVR